MGLRVGRLTEPRRALLNRLRLLRTRGALVRNTARARTADGALPLLPVAVVEDAARLQTNNTSCVNTQPKVR